MSRSSVPIDDAGRAEILDALRGFALLGILITHIPDFSGYNFLSAEQRHGLGLRGVDSLLSGAIAVFISGKFLSLFALLFGIGFAVQLESASRRGERFAMRYARRLLALLVIGAAHAALWYGDILKDYAILGFLLLASARWSSRAVAFAAVIVLLLRLIWPLVIAAAAPAIAPLLGDGDRGGDLSGVSSGLLSDDASTMFFANLQLLKLKLLQLIYEGRFLRILAMFLLGALIGKLGLYRDVGRHRPLLRRIFIPAAAIGLLGSAAIYPLHAPVQFPPSTNWVLEQTVSAIATPALTLAYAAAFALIWTTRSGRRFLQTFTPAGRTALSTYVSQSIFGISLFYGVGLGLHGEIGLAESVALALAVFTVQTIMAQLWLSQFQFGPLEWVWRTVTYGAPVRLLRERPSPMPLEETSYSERAQ